MDLGYAFQGCKLVVIKVSLMCLNIGAPKNINFLFGTNEKINDFRSPNTYKAHFGITHLKKEKNNNKHFLVLDPFVKMKKQNNKKCRSVHEH